MGVKGFRIIEFGNRILNPRTTTIRSHYMYDSSFIMLSDPKLRLHPQITFSAYDGNLTIDPAPFVLINADNTISLYSIALESSVEKPFNVQYHGYDFYLLDQSSILVSDCTTNRILGVFKVSIPRHDIEHVDLVNRCIHVKSVHPLGNSIMYLSSDNVLSKLSFVGSDLTIEPICKCDTYALGKYAKYAVLLCQCGSGTHAVVSNRVYGVHIELDKALPISRSRQVYGYLANNVCFIRVEDTGLILKLDDGEVVTVNSRLEPIAVLGNGAILGITPNNVLTVYDIEKNRVHNVARLDIHSLRDLHVDPVLGNVVLTYDDVVYLFNVQENPKYVKLRLGNTAYSAISVNDILIVFKRGGANAYRVNLTPVNISVDGLPLPARDVVRCANLGRNVLLCLDRFGRIIWGRVQELVLNLGYRSCWGILRSSVGVAMGLYGHYTLLDLGNTSNNSIHKLRSDFVLVSDPKTLFKSVAATYTVNEMFGNPHKVDVDISGLSKACLLRIGKNISIAIGHQEARFRPFLTIVDGAESVKVRLDRKDYNDRLHDLVIDGLKVYIAGESGAVEWGVATGFSLSVNLQEVLSIDNDIVCLSKEFNKLSEIKVVALRALCSNTVLRHENCIDLAQCENLLKLYLDIITKDGSPVHIALPMDSIKIPKAYLVEGDKAFVVYEKGVQKVMLPKKCVEIESAQLLLFPGARVEISFANRCGNVGATLIVNNNILFLKPKEKKLVGIEMDISNILDDHGVDVLVYESTGLVARYILQTSLESIIARAYGIALKISKLLGIKNVRQIRSHVREDVGRSHKEEVK